MCISFQVTFLMVYLTIITFSLSWSLFNVIDTGYKHSIFSDLRVKNIQYGFSPLSLSKHRALQ